MKRVGMDESVERTGDKLPILGACVSLAVWAVSVKWAPRTHGAAFEFVGLGGEEAVEDAVELLWPLSLGGMPGAFDHGQS
jgi:hypothetical protein